MIEFNFTIPQEFENCSGIYKISNNVNSKIYVGRTKNFLKRFKSHKSRHLIINHKLSQFLFENQNVTFNFCLVEITEDLKNREEFYIKFFNSVEDGFNIFYTDEDFFELCKSIKRFRKKAAKQKSYLDSIDSYLEHILG